MSDGSVVEQRELRVPGAFELTPRVICDDRGSFSEWFQQSDVVRASGRPLSLVQANSSTSGIGVLRGIHFAAVPPGQAKYVYCPSGAVFDVAVDLRVGSPTFGAWDGVVLDDVDRRAVFLSEGIGHAFMSLAAGSTVVYLCSEGYAPGREFGVDPFDPVLGIRWPTSGRDGTDLSYVLSDKDRSAPSVAQARASGVLPSWPDCEAYLEGLRGDPVGGRSRMRTDPMDL